MGTFCISNMGQSFASTDQLQNLIWVKKRSYSQRKTSINGHAHITRLSKRRAIPMDMQHFPHRWCLPNPVQICKRIRDWIESGFLNAQTISSNKIFRIPLDYSWSHFSLAFAPCLPNRLKSGQNSSEWKWAQVVKVMCRAGYSNLL